MVLTRGFGRTLMSIGVWSPVEGRQALARDPRARRWGRECSKYAQGCPLGRTCVAVQQERRSELISGLARRNEAGLVSTIEQPSVLPKAVKLLVREGIDEMHLIEQCRVSPELFRIITTRMPEDDRWAVRAVNQRATSGRSG